MDDFRSREMRERAGKPLGESPEGLSRSAVVHGTSMQLATTCGVINFDSEGFLADVINSVNDLTIGGFNSMEEFAKQALDLNKEGARDAIKLGVDIIYHKVQDSIDEDLSRWESTCRDHYFKFPEVANVESSSEEDLDDIRNEEQGLDDELCSLRSQLIAAERESTKMRRELTAMAKQLALRREVLGGTNVEAFNADVLEDVMKSARELKDKIAMASSLPHQNPSDYRWMGRGDSRGLAQNDRGMTDQGLGSS